MNESVVRDIAVLESNVDEAFVHLCGVRDLLAHWRYLSEHYAGRVSDGKAQFASQR